MAKELMRLLNTLDLLWVLTLFVVVLLFIIAIKSSVEVSSLKKHLAERNEILKDKFNITEDLV